MGNSNTSEPKLESYMNSQQFKSNMQGVYTGTSHIPQYPGGNHDDDDHAEVPAPKATPMKTQNAMAVKNDFTIDKLSVKLVPAGGPSAYYLSFKFSSLTDVEISIYYHGKDITTQEDNTEYIHIDTNKYPPIKSYIFGPVKDQEFPAHASILDTKVYSKDDLTKLKDGHYPLIIKMETKTDRMDLPKKRLYTYFAFKYNGSTYESKFLKQKFEVHGVAYIIDDIYGIANSDLNANANMEGKDCTICLTNKINTVVLPCKHMCLCLECATDLKERNNQKCPMCRQNVDNYLILKKS